VETVRRFESGFERPWDVSVLDPTAVVGLLQGVVAFEIPIVRLEGKRKLGQNRSREDREAMVRGLREHSGPSGQAIADLVQEDLVAR
jgi:transcriptional regulator